MLPCYHQQCRAAEGECDNAQHQQSQKKINIKGWRVLHVCSHFSCLVYIPSMTAPVFAWMLV